MMNSTPEMSSSLLGDDGASSSQKSGRSLLERIQLQRQREQGEATGMPQQVVQVPQQQQQQPETFYSNPSSSPFQTPWSNPFGSSPAPAGATGSTIEGFGGLPTASGGMGESLLNGGSNMEEYSMGNYFMTFVRDIYGLFMHLHIAVRVVVVCGLLYAVYWLL